VQDPEEGKEMTEGWRELNNGSPSRPNIREIKSRRIGWVGI
jgi:hypothetical protein